jgi:hypothetical protein
MLLSHSNVEIVIADLEERAKSFREAATHFEQTARYYRKHFLNPGETFEHHAMPGAAQTNGSHSSTLAPKPTQIEVEDDRKRGIVRGRRVIELEAAIANRGPGTASEIAKRTGRTVSDVAKGLKSPLFAKRADGKWELATPT